MSTQDIILKALEAAQYHTDKDDIEAAKQCTSGREHLYRHNNNTAEIERLEKALKEIKDKKVDKEFAKDKFTEILIENLYSQIAFLREEVGYLRDYSSIKGHITNIITENVPGLIDHRINIKDGDVTRAHTSQSNIQSPFNGSAPSRAPSTIATYMQGPNGKHNALNTSQHLDSDDLGEDIGHDSDIGNDSSDLLITSSQLNNRFSIKYITPLGITNHLSNDASDEETNSSVSSEEVYNTIRTAIPIVYKKNRLLSDDESIPEPHSIFQADGIPRMNERWQSAVIFMLVMSFLILVCCLIPIVLIPR